MLVGRLLRNLRRAERRDFEHLRADVHVNEAEPATDDIGAPEQRLHLLWRGVGRDVEVLRCQAEQQVAYCAPDDERPESRLVQLFRHHARAAGHLILPHGMLVRDVDARIA